ncbi:hypothetical protein HGG76_21310 [Ochrobactrum tritici]|uniref:Uncharacterized protein n=1 Tax=Brucella tritici TaxID=94626 RepID=A0A7X6FUT9_9HYPH|nr:hypothetical protein [Brucella tritici]
MTLPVTFRSIVGKHYARDQHDAVLVEQNSPATSFRNVSDRILRLLRLPELFLCTLLAIFFAGKFVLMRKAATDSFAVALIQHDAAILAALLFLYAFNLYFRKIQNYAIWPRRPGRFVS